jgi:ATP-dependent DNA ligase
LISSLLTLHLVEGFDGGGEAARDSRTHAARGIVSKRRNSPYGSGECRDWVKLKTEAWRAAKPGEVEAV